MKFGVGLHIYEPVDAILEEARLADERGYDSVWLGDHLIRHRAGEHYPDQPGEMFTLATAIGAVTKQVKVSWATLNLTFRNPAVLAKMLTTLDQITHGRVIACVGSGWLPDECEFYNIPFLEGHGDRMDYAREVLELWNELWTHPAPERVTYQGKYVSVKDLPFNPLPYQQPGIPIWWGGDSEASLAMAKQYATGWFTISRGTPEELDTILAAPDWPRDREMAVVKGARISVHEDRNEALKEARRDYEVMRATTTLNVPESFEEYLDREVAGTPDECLERLAVIESWGINYLRLNFSNLESQERVARLLLPRLPEIERQAGVVS